MKFNLAQFAPAAPMALASYNDFVAHDKTEYPFKASKGLSPVFKVVLNSTNANVVNNAYVFSDVNLSDATGKILRCGVQSIISSGNIVGTSVYNLHLSPLVQMRGYDSRTRSITDLLFSGRAGIDYVISVNQIDCNTEIDADTVRRTNQLSLFFTDINGNRILATNAFQVTLFFYEAN